MEDNKFNHWAYPPASTPSAQQDDEFDPILNLLNNHESIGTDPAFPPLNQSSIAPVPWRPIHWPYQTYTYAPSNTGNNPMVDLNLSPNFQDPNIVPNFYRQSYLRPQQNVPLPPQYSSFRNSGNRRESNDLTSEVGGSEKTALYQPQHTVGTSSYNQNQMSAAQFGNLRREDGSFLSLGKEDKPYNVPSSVNVSHFQGSGNSMNPAPNISGFSGSGNNVGVLPGPHNNMAGFSSTGNNVGYVPNVRPSHVIQRPQASRQHYFPKPSNIMPNANTRNANVDPYDMLRARMTSHPGPSTNSPTAFSHPAQMGVSNVPSSSVQPSSDRLQKLFHESMRINWARNGPFSRHMGSSFRPGYHPGQVMTSQNHVAQAGYENTQLLMRRHNQLPGRMIPSPENYGHLQASDHHGIPPIKRTIIHPNPNLARVQRRRMTPQFPSSPYAPSWAQNAPAPSVHIPSSRSGSGGAVLSGYKCMLCKRDLTFAPEGPIHQPSILPGVAVLSCQHTFHDHCLQLITPEDQAKDPPCIPCAMGEK